MSEDSNNGGRLNAQQDIDAMVSSEAYRYASGRGEPINVQADRGAHSVTVGLDGEVKHETLREPQAGSSSGRIPDSGVNIPEEAAKLSRHIQSLQARLDAISGYDPKTGKALPLLPYGSKERADVERGLEQRKRTAAYQADLWARLQKQRDADAEEARKQAALKNFIGNDPERAAAVKRELIDREASALVDKLFGPKAH